MLLPPPGHVHGNATVLGAVKGRALSRPPQAVSSLDRPRAPWPPEGVGTKGVPSLSTSPPAGRTKGIHWGAFELQPVLGPLPGARPDADDTEIAVVITALLRATRVS
jgi:hypothetical protein